jgi:DNA-binding NtrC family response regulator
VAIGTPVASWFVMGEFRTAEEPDDAKALEAPPGRILVVDDDRLIRWSLCERLEAEGHAVVEAEDGESAVAAFDGAVDAVLLDYRLPDADGLEVLRRLRAIDSDVPIIMITAHSSVDHAVRSMKLGAFHYLVKPFELDEAVLMIERAQEMTRLRRSVRALASDKEAARMASIVGESEPMRKIKELIPRVAASPASTVLVTGESGTGKDLVARAIHRLSPRADEPFVNITCSALPSALLESELFGHERGAFTDAKVRKQGLLEQASGGTVFLDEIGEMEMALQAKLLRFLEERTFRPVGGTAEVQADVRVVAATNVDLQKAVREGAFREDLYYRLAVVTLHLPPLRERIGDIDLLVAYLVSRFNREFGKHVRSLSRTALQLLRTHPWPGNVRELRNAIERAILLAEAETLEADDFAFLRETAVDETQFQLPAGGVDIRDLERSLVEQALERTSGNQTHAARLLGMNRDQIRYRMQRYGLLSRHRNAN